MILSIDTGWGYVKYCVYDETTNKIVKIDKEVTGIMEVPEGDSSIVSNVDTYHVFDGKRYLIGELATKLDREPLDIMKYEGFKEAGPILVSYLLNKFSTNNITKISLGLSPAIWDKREDYKQNLIEKLGLEEEKVDIHAQGVSGHFTYYTFGLDVNSDGKISMEPKSENYVLVDIGTNTIDSCLIINSSLLDYGIKGFLGKGVINVVEQVREYVYTSYLIKITQVEAKEVVVKGGFKKRGKFIDLSDKIAEFITDYLIDTFKFMEETYGDQFDRVDNILLFGGGAEIIKIYMQKSDTIKDKIEELYGEGYLLIPTDKAEYYNTIGYALQSKDNK